LIVRFQVFTVVTTKNDVFLDVGPCIYFVNRRFGGMYRLHIQGIKNTRDTPAHVGSSLADSLYSEDGGDTLLRNVG
jgi:hypothetical protein